MAIEKWGKRGKRRDAAAGSGSECEIAGETLQLFGCSKWTWRSLTMLRALLLIYNQMETRGKLDQNIENFRIPLYIPHQRRAGAQHRVYIYLTFFSYETHIAHRLLLLLLHRIYIYSFAFLNVFQNFSLMLGASSEHGINRWKPSIW